MEPVRVFFNLDVLLRQQVLLHLIHLLLSFKLLNVSNCYPKTNLRSLILKLTCKHNQPEKRPEVSASKLSLLAIPATKTE